MSQLILHKWRKRKKSPLIPYCKHSLNLTIPHHSHTHTLTLSTDTPSLTTIYLLLYTHILRQWNNLSYRTHIERIYTNTYHICISVTSRSQHNDLPPSNPTTPLLHREVLITHTLVCNSKLQCSQGDTLYRAPLL